MLAMAATFLIFSGAQSASAAAYGPGFDDAQNGGRGRIGAYSFEGHNVYCLQPWLPRPLDETTKGDVVDGQQFQMSDDSTARVNWAISTHGQSADPVVTSAVAMFVWSLAAPDSYASHGTSGDEHYLGRVPADRRGEVSSTLATIREGATKVGARTLANHSGSLQFTTDAADAKKGTVTLSSDLSGATGTVVLSGATFASTGTDTATLTVGEASPIVVSSAGFERGPVTVSATAKVTSPTEPWAAKILLLHTPGAQLLGSSGGTVPGEFTAVGQDRVPRVPTPAPTPTATATATATASPTPTPTPTRTAAPPRIPSPTPSVTAAPTTTQVPTTTPTPTPTQTAASSVTPTHSTSPITTPPPASPAPPTTAPTAKPPAPTTKPVPQSTTEAGTPSSTPSVAPTSGPSTSQSPTASATAASTAAPPRTPSASPTSMPAGTAAAAPTTPTSAQPETLAQTGASAVSWPLLLGGGALVVGALALAWGFLSRRHQA
ncbi:hypothetical protein GCM10027427_31000 [Pseudoclavibacter terrae]